MFCKIKINNSNKPKLSFNHIEWLIFIVTIFNYLSNENFNPDQIERLKMFNQKKLESILLLEELENFKLLIKMNATIKNLSLIDNVPEIYRKFYVGCFKKMIKSNEAIDIIVKTMRANDCFNNCKLLKKRFSAMKNVKKCVCTNHDTIFSERNKSIVMSKCKKNYSLFKTPHLNFNNSMKNLTRNQNNLSQITESLKIDDSLNQIELSNRMNKKNQVLCDVKIIKISFILKQSWHTDYAQNTTSNYLMLKTNLIREIKLYCNENNLLFWDNSLKLKSDNGRNGRYVEKVYVEFHVSNASISSTNQQQFTKYIDYLRTKLTSNIVDGLFGKIAIYSSSVEISPYTNNSICINKKIKHESNNGMSDENHLEMLNPSLSVEKRSKTSSQQITHKKPNITLEEFFNHVNWIH